MTPLDIDFDKVKYDIYQIGLNQNVGNLRMMMLYATDFLKYPLLYAVKYHHNGKYDIYN